MMTAAAPTTPATAWTTTALIAAAGVASGGNLVPGSWSKVLFTGETVDVLTRCATSLDPW